jgi:hypothetical protein
MSKSDDLKRLAEDRGNRHISIAATRFAELCSLGDAVNLPRTEPGKQPRSNRDLMRYIETAVQCLQANATAVESEIVTVSLSIYRQLSGTPKSAFAKLFSENELQPSKSFRAKNAKQLYRLVAEIIDERRTLRWPTNAYEKIAEPRNMVVHRTNKLLPNDLIHLTEDENPGDLRRQVEVDPLWWTSRKGLRSSEIRQCSIESHVPNHSRKTPCAA